MLSVPFVFSYTTKPAPREHIIQQQHPLLHQLLVLLPNPIPLVCIYSTSRSSPAPPMSNSSDNPVPSVDVLAANDLIQLSGYRYLDVRTEEEFKKGHVDLARSAALNVPYMFNTPQGRVKNPEFMEQVTRLYSKEDHIIVGCQSGVRSAYATADLVEADFKDVKNMKGGFLAWVENGLPVTKPPEAEL